MADLSDLAAELEPELERTFLAALEAARSLVPLDQLEAAFEANRMDVVTAILERAVREGLLPAVTPYLNVVQEVMKRAVLATTTIGFPAIIWPIIQPRTLEWINDNAGKDLVGVNAQTMTAVRAAIRQGHVEGRSPKMSAYLVRDVIGLTPRYRAARDNYATYLDSEPIPQQRREELIDLYSWRLKTSRAKTIARTETLAAANAGQYLAWQERIKSGLLIKGRTFVKWVTHDDDLACPYCAALDGTQVLFGEDFKPTHKGFPAGFPGPTPGPRKTLRPDPYAQKRDLQGRFAKAADPVLEELSDREKKRLPPVLHPPLHPNCRCYMVLVFKNAGEAPVATAGASPVQVTA